jgi:HEPN domain-containing protein
VNRAELRQLAEDRILDAKHLLAAGRSSGAYYLAGYAVECGLKACIMALVERTGIIFEEKKFAERCWTHDLKELVKLAALRSVLEAETAANAVLFNNWQVVGAWTEESRYLQKTQAEAEGLYDAIVNDPHGVLTWIRKYW